VWRAGPLIYENPEDDDGGADGWEEGELRMVPYETEERKGGRKGKRGRSKEDTISPAEKLKAFKNW
jgi:hypothetical protein